ncbi:hypothetical protein [Gryllotalpicola protaetiae]|uniref:Uncharacterized protein n=1 Tax=Gryllotalpicola protaetiae TaxID=2419771 RepID=A0A387BJE9_9MICO|nr:hypothetical protein [Gryllotalpicola protaetiae]AYG02848.1 hypothetical protein D7I44_04470 [Gryllotalpicola protaetiae]
MTTDPLPRGAAKGTVSAVWAFALVAAVLIGVFSHADYDGAWLSLSLAASVVIALCIQLATQEKRGFVGRLASSVAGALVILAVATGVIYLIH